jgi:hypothetical protein
MTKLADYLIICLVLATPVTTLNLSTAPNRLNSPPTATSTPRVKAGSLVLSRASKGSDPKDDDYVQVRGYDIFKAITATLFLCSPTTILITLSVICNFTLN